MLQPKQMPSVSDLVVYFRFRPTLLDNLGQVSDTLLPFLTLWPHSWSQRCYKHYLKIVETSIITFPYILVSGIGNLCINI